MPSQHTDERLVRVSPPDWGKLARLTREKTGEHLSEEQVMKRFGHWDQTSKPKRQDRPRPPRQERVAGIPGPVRASRSVDAATQQTPSYCRSCGSSLARRAESTTTREVGDKLIETTTYRCRCGTGRKVKREVRKPRVRAGMECVSCGNETNFPSDAGLCVDCDPVRAQPDPSAPACFAARYLRAQPLGEWFRKTGREEKLKAISRVHSNRISAWVARGGRASEQTVDELMVALGEHPRAVPEAFWITTEQPQLQLLESREELADLMSEAA